MAVPGEDRGWEDGRAGGRAGGGGGAGWCGEFLGEAVTVPRQRAAWDRGLSEVNVAPQTTSVKTYKHFYYFLCIFSSLNSSNC